MRLRVVFAGTPAFAVPALRALAGVHQIVGVLTQPDRPAGRGRALMASPVKQAALELGVPVAQPPQLRGDSADATAGLATLRSWQPDVMVVVAYGLILPPDVLTLPRLGCLNIHASLLPRWRGAAPIQRAILAGDAHTGISIMQMDAGLDTGAVLCTERIAIGAQTTSAQLHDELARAGARQILHALDGLARGTLVATPQPQEGVTYAQKLTKSEARIDWNLPARQIDRQVRAFNPWPSAQTTLGGEPIKLWRSRVAARVASDVEATDVPGTLLGAAGDALQVKCGEGVLEVTELQRAGRKAVPARDFINALPAGADRAVFQ